MFRCPDVCKSKSGPKIPIKMSRKLWRIRQAAGLEARAQGVQRTVV